MDVLKVIFSITFFSLETPPILTFLFGVFSMVSYILPLLSLILTWDLLGFEIYFSSVVESTYISSPDLFFFLFFCIEHIIIREVFHVISGLFVYLWHYSDIYHVIIICTNKRLRELIE